MKGSQNYIGTPCGLVVCADCFGDRPGDPHNGKNLSGRFYHFYSREGKEFSSIDELVFGMGKLYDGINFPHPSDKRREFAGISPSGHMWEERRKVMGEEELLANHGDLGTFIVRVQHRQNSSWQGRLTWCDKNQTVNFRSVWEMVRLIEDALDTVGCSEAEHGNVRWPEE